MLTDIQDIGLRLAALIARVEVIAESKMLCDPSRKDWHLLKDELHDAHEVAVRLVERETK